MFYGPLTFCCDSPAYELCSIARVKLIHNKSVKMLERISKNPERILILLSAVINENNKRNYYVNSATSSNELSITRI